MTEEAIQTPAEPVVETTEQPEPPRPLEDVLADLNRHYETAADATKAELRKHPVVSGMAGEIAQAQARVQREADERDRETRAAEQARENLRKLAENEPEEFAKQYLTEDAQKRIQDDQRTLRYTERKALAEQVSRGTSALPEWKELTPAEQSRVSKALIGVPDDQILGAYQTVVVDIVADKRAAKKFEREYPERLAAEKEAWEAEQAASRVKRTPAPDLRSGKAAGNDTGEPDFRDKAAWDAWYEDRHRQYARR